MGSWKLPGLGGSTPEAECQWWADRLGDEKTRRGRLSAYEKMLTVFPHPRRRLTLRLPALLLVSGDGDATDAAAIIRDMCLLSGAGFPDVLVVDLDTKFTSDVCRAFVKRLGLTGCTRTPPSRWSGPLSNTLARTPTAARTTGTVISR